MAEVASDGIVTVDGEEVGHLEGVRFAPSAGGSALADRTLKTAALRAVNREEGITVLCNLHHLRPAKTCCDRIIGMSAGRVEVHTGVVDVPDPRVDKLSSMFKPKKTIYAKVTYADIAGLEGNASKTGISGTLLNQLTQMDAFLQVVRCFEDDNVPHPNGSIDPARDLAAMESEFILNDLIAVERKLERLAEEKKKLDAEKAKRQKQNAPTENQPSETPNQP